MSITVNPTFCVRITGTRPFLMSSSAGVAPQGEIGKRLKELMKIRKRTDADVEEMQRLKYLIACYYDEKIGIYVPGYNLWASIRDAAKIFKMGTAWIRGAQIIEDKLPFEYDGPRTPEELYADERFVDVRVARVSNGSSIEAVRPFFKHWSLEASILIDDAAISVADARRAIELAGSMVGLGTFRQRFGRFEVQFLENGGLKKAA